MYLFSLKFIRELRERFGLANLVSEKQTFYSYLENLKIRKLINLSFEVPRIPVRSKNNIEIVL